MAVALLEVRGISPAGVPLAGVGHAGRDQFQGAKEAGEVRRRVVVDRGDRLGVAAEALVRVRTVGADDGDDDVTARRQGRGVARYEVTRGLRGAEVQQVTQMRQAGSVKSMPLAMAPRIVAGSRTSPSTTTPDCPWRPGH